MAEVSSSESVQQSSSSLKEKVKKDECKSHQKSRQRGLMTKLGKSDLLRLLSILEGELEARDIFITDLQAKVNHDRYTKQRYFQHDISDPFLALMRDNEAMCGSVTSSQTKPHNKSADNENMGIEPLPLLEKVVTECKRQQVKVQRHIALSDAYYKLVNNELKEVKRKHSESTSESGTHNTLEREYQELKVELQAERARSRKMTYEYKNLLQAINKERHRFQIILTMLLEDRRRSKEVDVDVVMSADDSQNTYDELAKKNKDLESVISRLKQNETVMKDEIDALKQQLCAAQMKLSSFTGADSQSSDNINCCNDVDLIATRDVKNAVANTMCSPRYSCNSNAVSVKRTSSVVENRKLAEKFPIGSVLYQSTNNTKVQNATENNVLDNSSKVHSIEKPALHSTELRLKLSSSSIVSSPTSGAANFALNSPNLPPSSLPFSAPVVPAKAQRPASAGLASFQATRQKFQRITKPYSATSSKANDKVTTNSFHDRSAKHGSDVTDNASALSSLRSEEAGKKHTDNVAYKPQPPKPPKVKSTSIDLSESSSNIRPPPLPPKKPSLTTKQSSGKVAPNRQSKDHEGVKKTNVNSRMPNPKTSSSNSAKSMASNQGSNKSSIKRPTSLNTNNNNFNLRSSGRMSKSGSIPAPLTLSAQQRLFPPQDGANGQLRSPVTNTVPKSPLDSCFFTYK